VATDQAADFHLVSAVAGVQSDGHFVALARDRQPGAPVSSLTNDWRRYDDLRDTPSDILRGRPQDSPDLSFKLLVFERAPFIQPPPSPCQTPSPVSILSSPVACPPQADDPLEAAQFNQGSFE
jgi:hypothetical protein